MSQIPPILLSKLAQLRRRERFLRFVWGLACVATIVVVVLIFACFVDWLVDLWNDTPWGLRRIMRDAQVAIALLAVLGLVIWPQMKHLHNNTLALWVEDRWPALQHRLITALQLNQPGARIQGMSPEMMSAVTHEALEQTRPIHFPAIADHRRLKRGAKLFAPVALLALGLFVLDPAVVLALLQRQMLEDVDIPRSVSLYSDAPLLWPSGEEAALRFVVRGIDPNEVRQRTGTLRVEEKGDNGRVFNVPLAFDSMTDKKGYSSYVAKVPPGSVNFSYTAKLVDGRTREPGQVEYVARPSVIDQKAFVILPSYVGLRPNGSPYEQEFPRGDIVSMGGLTAKVVIKTQKPIQRAVLELFGSPYPDLSGSSGLTRMHEQRAKVLSVVSAAGLRSAPLGPVGILCAVNAGGANLRTREPLQQEFPHLTSEVEWKFDLRPTETSYRVVVFDVHGFASKTETVRTIRIEPEPSPTVVLHAERWDPKEEFQSKGKKPDIHDFEGMPIPLVDGVNPGPVRITYEAHGPFGIGKAQLKIGVIRGSSESEDPKNPKIERWVTLDLDEVPMSSRPFDKSKGAFFDSPDDERVPFYAMPSPDPAKKWPRTFAGGRYEYKPGGLLDESGKPFAFKTGDQVVVYVEVFNNNPDPAKALMAKSRLREREVVPWETFFRWCTDTLQEASRVEALVYMQQQVYDRPWFSIFGFGK